MSEVRQLCSMVVGEYVLGIDVAHVQEVIGYQPTTSVAKAPSVISGLINLRGQILTGIDLAGRLNVASGLRADDDGVQRLPMNVVVHTSTGPVGLLVDAIGQVVEVSEAQRETIPSTVDAVTRDVISSVYKFDDVLLLELDVERVVDLSLWDAAVASAA